MIMKKAKLLSSRSGCKGFTLVELLVALIVSSIIMTAVVSLAEALSSVDDDSDDTRVKQAQIRYATLVISDLIRHSKLICGTPEDRLAVWKSDDNGDNQINPGELAYIRAESARDFIKLEEFSPPAALESAVISVGDIRAGRLRAPLIALTTATSTTLVPVCSNVQFRLDTTPPWTRSVSISFNITENGTTQKYQIDGTLQSWAGHLLDAGGEIVVSDDD